MKKRKSGPSNSKRAGDRKATVPGRLRAAGRTREGKAPSPDPANSSRVTPVPPGREALQRLLAIPLLYGDVSSSPSRAGTLAQDSWQHGPTIALRDVEDGQIRRLRFEAGKYSLEVLALRTGQEWEFTARLRRGERVVHGSVLSVGRRRLLALRGGYFHWSSSSVPRRLAVLLFGEQLVFEEIPWR